MGPRVLITGGTGFLGKRLALTLKDRYPTFLTGRNNKQNLMARAFTGCPVLPMDVSNIESVRDIFAEVKPAVVVHAAAVKFVDLAERHPLECIDVNVVGSQNVARVAVEKGVDAVLGISTAKAVPPVRNTYGLSKAIMERLFCALNGKTATKFVCVRFGNVAWSTGSVLTVWNKMHKQDGVIWTTGPEMTRFLFTADEAVGLILTALDRVEELQGRVLTRKMKATKIKDILGVWVAHKGGTWKLAEARPGERADEYLIGELERAHTYEAVYQGVVHYVVSFNEVVASPFQSAVSSANSERLSDQEILDIINRPPVEEA